VVEEKERVRLFTRTGAPMRIFLMNSAIFIVIGIWLTGFDKVHWFIYFIPGIFALSSIFGVCPGLNLWQILLKK
jgi:hypothetical protein